MTCRDVEKQLDLFLDGELEDEFGRYGVHDWLRQPHNSHHQVDAPNGCLTFSLAHHLRPPIPPR